ncbi:hypothetical protein CN582_16345 [Bacillus wiedmannii]|uniref:hypothetical protein n=1 Tax=Bacillus wiedmannii TaxID=1890302 RepID=UPI000BF54D67|nr:hypothetical protein [Bacillus wiedmannii]PEP22053.1 hypothetical protein CN580_19815 [Bacillus wiedmannii]PEP96742.1 hypothetical protein CN582_16345 [Bacillus wiedmannii]PFY72452.1 hypothetical protein COL61_14120 [Bacillus wiedmannii]
MNKKNVFRFLSAIIIIVICVFIYDILDFLKNSDPTIMPIISLLGGFTGASIGQVVGHYFTQSRDTTKDTKEKYQHLYSPIAHKIIYYLECEQDYFMLKLTPAYLGSATYSTPDYAFKKVIETINNNLKYATPQVVAMSEELNRISNTDWDRNRSKRMQLCEALLTEYFELSEKLKFMLPTTKKSVTEALFICKFDILCKSCYYPSLFGHLLNNGSIISSIKNTNELNKQIDKAKNQIIKLRKKNKKHNNKMEAYCFEPGVTCLKNIIETIAPNIYIKGNLIKVAYNDEEYMNDYISQMDADGTVG